MDLGRDPGSAGTYYAAVGGNVSYREIHAGCLRRLDAHWNEKRGVFCDIGGGGKQRCHVGYVSIFPLLLQHLAPDDARLGRLIAVAGSPGALFSPAGLRSLSAGDAAYRKGDDYWRGKVWINCNFLALQALHRYRGEPGPAAAPAAELYSRLRGALLGNMAAAYGGSGFLWENYDDRTGQGTGTKPFTGWSALSLLVLSERY